MENPKRLKIADDYASDFSYESDLETNRKNRASAVIDDKPKKSRKLPSSSTVVAEYEKEERQTHRLHFLSLDAYSRHKKMVNDYLQYYGGKRDTFKRDTSKDKTDMDIIRENHQFLWDDYDDDTDESSISWEKKLAKKYWDKLFKEYCIADLSNYKENKIGMRWQIEKEVIIGKGQFICGNKKCSQQKDLTSWEVNFQYVEGGQTKNALVKLRLCVDCSYKLNYRHKRKQAKNKSIKSDKKQSSHESEKLNIDDNLKRDNTIEKQQSKRDDNIWSGSAPIIEEVKTRDEEFDEYLKDMFM